MPRSKRLAPATEARDSRARSKGLASSSDFHVVKGGPGDVLYPDGKEMGLRVIGFLAKVDRVVMRLERGLAAALMLMSVALIVVDVTLRAGFSVALSWAGEATRYSIIWLVFIAGSIGARSSTHISIDFLAETLPPRAARRVAQAAALIASFTSALLAWFGWELVVQMRSFGQVSPSLEWPMWVIYLAVPLGSALMSLRFLQSALSADPDARRTQIAHSAA